jgi:iron(III) transport system ATP-binding protein
MIKLKVHGLTKKYRGNRTLALDNFNLEVAQGEIVALLGESGCGKTTALRVIAGFEIADCGTVTIDGLTVVKDGLFVEPDQRGVGIVFQDYALFPHKTVLENISFGLHKLSKKERNNAAMEVLELTGMTGYESRYPHQLSGGQKQRVALARAMAPRPGILLLDEPFSNIDSVRKNQIRAEIRTILKEAGTTAIFVTHDTKDVLAIADRVAVMQDGVVLQNGTPAEVYNHPGNVYLANFFGKTNILKASLSNGWLETPIGTFMHESDKLSNSYTKVNVSIRPDVFIIVGEEEPGGIPVTVIDQRFMGEYNELLCVTRYPNRESVHLSVFISPGQLPDKQNCCITIRKDGIHVLSQE